MTSPAVIFAPLPVCACRNIIYTCVPVYPHPQLLTPSALHSLRHLTNLKSLELEHTNVGDFELSIVLGALTSLTRVRFGGSFWTKEGGGRWCVVLTGRLGDL